MISAPFECLKSSRKSFGIKYLLCEDTRGIVCVENTSEKTNVLPEARVYAQMARLSVKTATYIGRLAPSPTGLLHLGHASTFHFAAIRAKEADGRLLMRMDDLDVARCRPIFAKAALQDLAWLGLEWEKPHFVQSSRLHFYRDALAVLHSKKLIYPCYRSRRDLAGALSAPHENCGIKAAFPTRELTPPQDIEPIYPSHWRPPIDLSLPSLTGDGWFTNWRYRVPDDRNIVFTDGRLGRQSAVAGLDIGDFLVWRKDGLPSYQLACAVDDATMGITEVVRGEDLVLSTFRQLLLIESLGLLAPAYWHTPLIKDSDGNRLAKRNDALSLATLRDKGFAPDSLLERFVKSPNQSQDIVSQGLET